MTKTLLAICLIPCLCSVAPADTKHDVSDLIHRLQTGDTDEKERAAEALGALGSEAAGAVNALRQALNDDLPYVRIRSAEALAKIGPAAIPAFIDALKNENTEVRATAANALGRYGDQAAAAIPSLVDALKDSDLPVRQGAARALEQLGQPAAQALVGNLENSHGSLKILTLQVLANIHGTDATAIPPLLKVLEDTDHQVRLAGVKALVHQGSEHVPELLEGLKSDNAMVRAQVADVLADVGRHGASAVPALTELLKDPTPQVRGSAARALGKMGSDAASAVPALRVAAKDTDTTVATKAAEALTNISDVFGNEIPTETAPRAQAKTASPQPPKSLAALPTVHQSPPKKKPAPPRKVVTKKTKVLPPPTPAELLILAQSTDTVVRTNAEQTIIQRSSETIPVLIPALQGTSTTLAEISTDLLTKIGTGEAKKAVDAYRKRLLDKRTASLLKDLRQEGKASADATQELVKIGAPIVKPVAQILADPRPSARRAAATVLNQLGTAASVASSSLIDALDDKDPGVRQQSAEALAKIGTPDAKKALRFFPIKDKIRRVLGYFNH